MHNLKFFLNCIIVTCMITLFQPVFAINTEAYEEQTKTYELKLDQVNEILIENQAKLVSVNHEADSLRESTHLQIESLKEEIDVLRKKNRQAENKIANLSGQIEVLESQIHELLLKLIPEN